MNCKNCKWCGHIGEESYVCIYPKSSGTFNVKLMLVGCSRYEELKEIETPDDYNEIESLLSRTVNLELDRANSLYPQFHSAHEAESVLREELEECVDELDELTANFEAYWNKIKSNNAIQQKIGLNQLKQCAEKLAIEVNQFRAMCEKAQAFYDKEGVE